MAKLIVLVAFAVMATVLAGCVDEFKACSTDFGGAPCDDAMQFVPVCDANASHHYEIATYYVNYYISKFKSLGWSNIGVKASQATFNDRQHIVYADCDPSVT